MNWFKNIDKNRLLYSGLIITFVFLYGATAFVSWYHSITFFNIANAIWLSVLLSFVAEVGQASVLFSILLTANKNKFLPWIIMIILTTLQVIGNVVSSYKYIIGSNSADFTYFQKSILFWVQGGTPDTFKIIIAWISGALLPIIALSMTALVAQNLKLREEEVKTLSPETPLIDAKDLMSEIAKIRPTEDDLKLAEEILSRKKTNTSPSVYHDDSPINQNDDNSSLLDIQDELVTPKEVLSTLSDEEVREMREKEQNGILLNDEKQDMTEDPIIPEVQSTPLDPIFDENDNALSTENGSILSKENYTPGDNVDIPKYELELNKTHAELEEKKRIEKELRLEDEKKEKAKQEELRLEKIRNLAKDKIKKK